MENNLLLQNIEFKRAILKQAKINLKNYFVGIDKIIDNVFSNLEIWYIMPDILTRPIIINLWGMTGIGKKFLFDLALEHYNFERTFEYQNKTERFLNKR